MSEKITPEDFAAFIVWRESQEKQASPEPQKPSRDPKGADFAFLYHLIPSAILEWNLKELLTYWDPFVTESNWARKSVGFLIKRLWIQVGTGPETWTRNPAKPLQTKARCELEYYLSGVPQRGPFQRPEYTANMAVTKTTSGKYLKKLVEAKYVQGEPGVGTYSRTVWRITRKGLELYNELFRSTGGGE